MQKRQHAADRRRRKGINHVRRYDGKQRAQKRYKVGRVGVVDWKDLELPTIDWSGSITYAKNEDGGYKVMVGENCAGVIRKVDSRWQMEGPYAVPGVYSTRRLAAEVMVDRAQIVTNHPHDTSHHGGNTPP